MDGKRGDNQSTSYLALSDRFPKMPVTVTVQRKVDNENKPLQLIFTMDQVPNPKP